MQLLYILPGPVPPEKDPKKGRFSHLSRVVEGHVLVPVWWGTSEAAKQHLGEQGYPVFHFGRFKFHLLLTPAMPKLFERARRAFFFVRRGFRLYRSDRSVSVIVTYGTNLTGLCAVALKYLTGAKLIAEIPGVPGRGYLLESPTVSRSRRWLQSISDISLFFVVKNADRVKLLYPTQLQRYPSLRAIPSSIFHDFVPVREIVPDAQQEPFILFLGHPWYLKGVDVLIRAFKDVAAEIPTYELRIVGYMPDRRYLEELAEGHPGAPQGFVGHPFGG